SRWSVPWIGRKSASPAAVAAGCSVACGIGMDLEKSSVHPPVFYRGADCHCAEMCRGRSAIGPRVLATRPTRCETLRYLSMGQIGNRAWRWTTETLRVPRQARLLPDSFQCSGRCSGIPDHCESADRNFHPAKTVGRCEREFGWPE